MASKRNKYTEEFKKDTVALSYKSDKSMAETADNLGIHRSLLVRWRKEFDEYGDKAFPGNGLRKLTPLEEENLRLKRELAYTKEERDILKKAVHIFSRKSK